MKKLLVLILSVLVLGLNCAYAAKPVKRDFNSVISESEIEKNSIAISFKDLNTGKPVYELNEKILMHPASVQKILTLVPAVEVLGEDYNYTTSIYSRGKDEFVIKLGADPYFSYKDLKSIVNYIGVNTKTVYIDDKIVEKKDWGEGWQWDDDLNVLMPRFNSYNLDNNIMRLTVMPTKQGDYATIINSGRYPLVFFNNIITGDTNSVKVTRDNSISSNTLLLEGCVNKPLVLSIPVNNLKRNFDVRLTNALSDKKVYLKQNFISSQVYANDKELDKITHPISQGINDILKNSNNLVSEITVKLAGGKAYNDIGTDINGIKVFNAFCEKQGLDNSRIRIVDASGVSKNNLVTADFITEFLVKNKDNKVLAQMAAPGEGTLTHRMLPIKDNLKAKTGTLADISSIAGFLTSKSGNKYAFSIIINDPSSTSSDMKTLEDYLIREAYLRL